jgi:hypothetical protein
MNVRDFLYMEDCNGKEKRTRKEIKPVVIWGIYMALQIVSKQL